MAIDVLVVQFGAGDDESTAVTSLLTARGDTVTAATSLTDAPAAGTYDVVVQTQAADLTDVAGYLALTDGIVSLRSADWVELLLCTATSAGLANATQIERQNTDHAIITTSGLQAGNNTVLSSASTTERMNPGTIAAGGVRLADDATGTDGRIVLSAFETGATLTTGTAAGRRVAYGAHAVNLYTDPLGQDVFLAAVDWAAGVLDPGAGGPVTLEAQAGAFPLTGSDAELLFHRVLTVGAGSFPLTGTDADLSLATEGSISRVVTLAGVPLEGATVFLINDTDGTLEGETTTDASGVYTFSGLALAKTYHAAAQYESGGTQYHGRSQPFLRPS